MEVRSMRYLVLIYDEETANPSPEPPDPERPDSDRLTGASAAHELVDRLFREESGRVVATLIRVLGDFDLAEEAVQDAFARAIEVWPVQGVPRNPAAWITTTARNAAIDRIRRTRRLIEKTEQLRRDAEVEGTAGGGWGDEMTGTDGIDDRLRLIFTCCHP